jgi:WD40 repeat protein
MCGLPSRLNWIAGIVICTAAFVPCRTWGQQPPRSDDSLRAFGSPRTASRQPPPVVTSIAISSDGSLLATGGDDALVNLWRIDDGRLTVTLRGHIEWVRSVAFRPDGKAVASAGDDRTIRIWDTNSGELIRTIGPAEAAIYAIQFHPEGKFIVAAGFDRNLHLYDSQTGNSVRQFTGPCNDIRAVAFSTDGTLLAAGGRDGQVRVWNTDDASPIRQWSAQAMRLRIAWQRQAKIERSTCGIRRRDKKSPRSTAATVKSCRCVFAPAIDWPPGVATISYTFGTYQMVRKQHIIRAI